MIYKFYHRRHDSKRSYEGIVVADSEKEAIEKVYRDVTDTPADESLDDFRDIVNDFIKDHNIRVELLTLKNGVYQFDRKFR